MNRYIFIFKGLILAVCVVCDIQTAYFLGSAVTLFWVSVTAALRIVFCYKLNILHSTSTTVFWIYAELHHTVGLILAATTFPYSIKVDNQSIEYSKLFSCVLLCSIFLIYFFTKRKHAISATRRINFWAICKKKQKQKVILAPMIIMFFVAYVLSVLSHILGISRMGQEVGVVLPFKLVGILNTFRVALMPIFCLFWQDYLLDTRHRIAVRIFLILYVPWLILESYIRFSRSAFVFAMELLFWLLLFRQQYNKKTILLIIITLVASLTMYFLTTEMRHLSGRQSDVGFADAYESMKVSDNDIITQTVHAIIRKSLGGYYAAKYVKDRKGSLFHNNYDEMVAYGGTALYNTYKIDKMPSSAVHSSGSSGIADAYVHFGIIGVIAFSFFLALGCAVVDSGKLGFVTKIPIGSLIATISLVTILSTGYDRLRFFLSVFDMGVPYVVLYKYYKKNKP